MFTVLKIYPYNNHNLYNNPYNSPYNNLYSKKIKNCYYYIMGIKRVFYDKRSSIVLSIVFGLGFISLLYACTGDDCKSFVGPKKSTLNDTFKVNGNCVKFEERSVKCDATKKKLHIS